MRERKPIGDHGAPRPEFLFEHGLNANSLPHEWFKSFSSRSLTGMWTSYTNDKALLSNAGQEGKIYPDWVPFTNDELRYHVGVYMVHGLSPLPHVSMKFIHKQKMILMAMILSTNCLDQLQSGVINIFVAFLLHRIQ